MANKKPIWIAGIARGHNGGVCLLKDGEVVFALEEERLTRHKYDGGPFATMMKILEYTSELDFLIVAHTQNLQYTAGKIDFSGDDVYTGLARKMGLIKRQPFNGTPHPQVIDLSHIHHKLHAACAFYRSGFDEAVALIVDGAGTFIDLNIGNQQTTVWETESIFDCNYPDGFKTLYKHLGTNGPLMGAWMPEFSSEMYDEPKDSNHELFLTENAGIVKSYEAVTEYCGFSFIEAGKTMGLFPYGGPNEECPKIFREDTLRPISDRELIVPTYPNGAHVNYNMFPFLTDHTEDDVTKLKNRRDLAYAVQTQSQDQVVRLIKKAVEMSGKNKVVISGGYGLNCVANYHYLDALKDTNVELYVEPVSNDAGTAMGAAMYWHRKLTKSNKVSPQVETLYEGPAYCYSDEEIKNTAEKYNATVKDAEDKDAVSLLKDRNIVTIFQGRSENGPRALGNRTIMYDPSDPNGKDHVNMVKRREYFRPFAGSILEEDALNWFDLRGMKSSPTMMYAVNCKDGVKEKIPAIIHVDDTCRIQTVNEKQNPLYYRLIKEWKKETGLPIIFNTSFNLGGEPLVETLDDAVRTLAHSDIEYLYLPEYGKLITLKN